MVSHANGQNYIFKMVGYKKIIQSTIKYFKTLYISISLLCMTAVAYIFLIKHYIFDTLIDAVLWSLKIPIKKLCIKNC